MLCHVSRDWQTNCRIFSGVTRIRNLTSAQNSITFDRPIKAIYSKPYQIPLSQVNQVKMIVDDLLHCNVKRPSCSSIISPAFAIPKKSGELRLVVDYKKLNEVTKKDFYPIPNLQDQLISLQGYEYFTQLDLNSGYHQISIKKEDIYKTSFFLPWGQYEYLRMPFGLCNAPRNFQRAMNSLLGKFDFVRVYLDDILILGKDRQDHFSNVEKVMSLLKENQITINFKKSNFMKTEVEYLGMIIDAEGIRPITTKLFTNTSIKSPKTIKDVQKLVGFINWFRPFLPNLATKLTVITDLLKTNGKPKKGFYVKWLAKHQNAVENIFYEIKYIIHRLHYPFTFTWMQVIMV